MDCCLLNIGRYLLEVDPGSCLDHLSPSIDLSSSDDITMDIISLSLVAFVRVRSPVSFLLRNI